MNDGLSYTIDKLLSFVDLLFRLRLKGKDEEVALKW